MRQRQRKPATNSKPPAVEPLAENVIPLRRNGRRDWQSLSDEELVGFAKGFISEHGVGGKKELEKADQGLYVVLRRRKLLDGIGLEERHRNWSAMGDEEMIGFARDLIAERGIRKRYVLEKADRGLYKALKKRKLLDKVGLKSLHRDWAAVGDDELIRFAKEFVSEEGIWSRKELENADIGLYHALRRRKLLDKVGLGYARRKQRDWVAMDDEELTRVAKRFITDEGIASRWELVKVDGGLGFTLKKRKLLDKVGLGYARRKQRDWVAMSDGELVAFAKGFIAERGIGGRDKLKKEDQGLYGALWRRELLDEVFADVERHKHAEAVQGVLDAIEKFGDQ